MFQTKVVEKIKTYFTFSNFLVFENFDLMWKKMVKVKQSRNRPGVAQRVPGGLGSQIS